jgi:hypothetical protein
MKTSLEIFDNVEAAQVRLIELQRAGAINPRKLQVERLAAYDRRKNPEDPPEWVREKATTELFLVQYER